MILVLVRGGPGPLRPPSALPIARAAQRFGLEVAFGVPGAAFRPAGDGWERVDGPFSAVHDRFPSATFPEEHAEALAALGDVPVGNPPELALLCRDKLLCQRELGALPMPEVVGHGFAEALARWGAAFLKPRFGAKGQGVRRVRPGDPLPVEEGAWVLQKALPSPKGYAGVCLRALVQREAAGWVACPVVARVSEVDPVVNVDRGARAVDARALLGADTVAEAERRALAVARRLERPTAVELGVDLVVDDQGEPWIIEVNGKPLGRLERVDEEEHLRACARPLLFLQSLPSQSESMPSAGVSGAPGQVLELASSQSSSSSASPEELQTKSPSSVISTVEP